MTQQGMPTKDEDTGSNGRNQTTILDSLHIYPMEQSMTARSWCLAPVLKDIYDVAASSADRPRRSRHWMEMIYEYSTNLLDGHRRRRILGIGVCGDARFHLQECFPNQDNNCIARCSSNRIVL
jgi:hypothetical protein